MAIVALWFWTVRSTIIRDNTVGPRLLAGSPKICGNHQDHHRHCTEPIVFIVQFGKLILSYLPLACAPLSIDRGRRFCCANNAQSIFFKICKALVSVGAGEPSAQRFWYEVVFLRRSSRLTRQLDERRAIVRGNGLRDRCWQWLWRRWRHNLVVYDLN